MTLPIEELVHTSEGVLFSKDPYKIFTQEGTRAKVIALDVDCNFPAEYLNVVGEADVDLNTEEYNYYMLRRTQGRENPKGPCIYLILPQIARFGTTTYWSYASTIEIVK